MKFLRTPDERFRDLPGYPFAPHYAEVSDGEGGRLRMHYVDEGPRDAAPVLLLHGEPSWSYLYRHMIPPLAAAGHRVIAPDLVGFGRSDKPTERSDYTYARHVEWLRELLFDRLALSRVVLFCQDWGGLLGLRLVAGHPDRFDGVMAANTLLLDGSTPAPEGFLRWRAFSQRVPEFPAGAILQGATVSTLDDAVVAAYDAPFPDESYKAGARQFPTLVPVEPDAPGAADNRRAWTVLERWDKPFLTAFSDKDPVTVGLDAEFQRRIPGCKGQPHRTTREAGHFLQEDKGEELAAVLVAFLATIR